MKEFSEFLSTLTNFTTGITTFTNPIRLHTRKLDYLGDLSFKCDAYKNLGATKQESLTDLLISDSKSWPISIHSYTFTNDVLSLFISRAVCFKYCITTVLRENSAYGCQQFDFKHTISVENDFQYDDVMDLGLTKLRAVLLKDTIVRILEFNKCLVTTTPEQSSKNIKVSLGGSRNDDTILSGHVTVAKSSSSDCSTVTASEFYRKRTTDMRLMAQHKYGLRITSEPGWSDFFSKLGEAAVTFELLQNNHRNSTTINLTDPASSSSKGASFILYNCARLSTMFKEFDKRISAGLYPPLPPLEEVDFSLLTQPEEWELLYVYAIQFPATVANCVKNLFDSRVSVHHLCKFLSALCVVFSCYYRRVRIMVESRDRLFAVIHARIYLLKAIEQMLYNGLYLLNIQPVKQM